VPATRIGTRASALARRQTEEVLRLWRHLEPDLEVEIREVATVGDEHPEAPLERSEGLGVFTSTLERALLAGEIDVAVHSYKDLPVAARRGLVVAAVPRRGPAEDALCARDGLRLADLPPGARVGTSSLRRRAQLARLRPDLDYRPVRGNVPTRLEKVATGELDAVVLARAGLERLGLTARATEVLAAERLLPAPGQGALAVQVRAADRALRARLARLEDPATRGAVEAERALLHALHGGCSVPVGAFATASGWGLSLEAGVFSLADDRALRVSVEGASWREAAREAARRLRAMGAETLLESSRAAGDAIFRPGPREAGDAVLRAPRRVAVTRDDAADGRLAGALRRHGLEPVDCAVIVEAPPADREPLRRAAEALERYDWLVAASARAVRALLAARDGRPLPPELRTAAVGAATAAALEACGARAPLTAPAAGAEALVEALSGADRWAGRSVLLPRATGGRRELARALRAWGAKVDEVVAYGMAERPGEEIRHQWRCARPDAAVVASPSAARALVGALGVEELRALEAVVAIGDTTARALAHLGVAATVPARADFEAAAELLSRGPRVPGPRVATPPRRRSGSRKRLWKGATR
jgi:hydroxymethylbilane synthase